MNIYDQTPDKMHTQMTQWCILAAPLLIGTDLTKMDALVKYFLYPEHLP